MVTRTLSFWFLALFLALSGAMMLVPGGVKVSTLEAGLGPFVETRPL